MNSKVLVGILFVVTFVVSFVIYLLLITFINPHLDLSNTAKKESEMGPSVEKAFQNSSDQRINLPNSSYTPISSQTSSPSTSQTNNNTSTYNQQNNTSNVENNSNYENTNNNSQEDNNSNSSSEANVYTPPPPPPVPSVATPPPPSLTIKRHNSTNNFTPPKPPMEIKKPLAPFKPDDTNSQKPMMDTNTQGSSTTMVPRKLNRVIVGSYKSVEEAQKASDNIASSNSSLKPVVKNLNGKYTIQVGAFSDRKRAEALANTLNSSSQAAAIKAE